MGRIGGWFETRSGRKELCSTNEEPKDAMLTIAKTDATIYIAGTTKMNSMQVAAPMNANARSSLFRFSPVTGY
jgi:hypothetical protein